MYYINSISTVLNICITVVCFDAKIAFDDSAEFRQKEIFAMEDKSESDPREVEADAHNLNYIGMEGNIGCLGEQKSLVFTKLKYVKVKI